MGIPAVESDFGIPVVEVQSNAPLMTISKEKLGTPIRITEKFGTPFIIQRLD